MADRAGQQLGHYRLIRQLGRGGFTDVYLGHVEDVKWSPDGTLIASAGQDQTIQIWNAATGSHLFTYNSHTSLIWAIDWSRSGQQIASASQDGSVRVWQAV